MSFCEGHSSPSCQQNRAYHPQLKCADSGYQSVAHSNSTALAACLSISKTWKPQAKFHTHRICMCTKVTQIFQAIIRAELVFPVYTVTFSTAHIFIQIQVDLALKKVFQKRLSLEQNSDIMIYRSHPLWQSIDQLLMINNSRVLTPSIFQSQRHSEIHVFFPLTHKCDKRAEWANIKEQESTKAARNSNFFSLSSDFFIALRFLIQWGGCYFCICTVLHRHQQIKYKQRKLCKTVIWFPTLCKLILHVHSFHYFISSNIDWQGLGWVFKTYNLHRLL